MTKWIARQIDLQNVAFTDELFNTKKEAMQALKNGVKINSYVDVIIKIELTNDELNEWNSLDNPFEIGLNAEIVYKR